MAYWGIALDLLGNTLAAPPSPQAARDAWDVLEKAQSVVVKTERERRWIDAIRAVLPRLTTRVPVDARLAAYNTAMQQLVERYPGRLRSAGVLRVDAAGVGAEERPDLRRTSSSRRRCSSSSTPTDPQHPGHHALPDSRLRLRAVCRQGHPGGAPLRRHRAGGAARAAHARAHLLDGRTVGGLDHVEPVGARDSARLLPRGGLHGVRAPAAGAGRQGRGDDRQGAERRRSAATGRRPWPTTRRWRRCRRDMCSSARDWAAAAALPVTSDRVSAGRFADALHARPRHGAHAATARGATARDRRACRRCATRAGEIG